ncbi:hypothetical protein DD581_34440, partial [Klebsiella pneumoniae]
LYAKCMALARRNKPNFVRAAKIFCVIFIFFSTLNALIFARCAKKGTGHPETKHCPSRAISWGYEYLEKKLMDEKRKKKLDEAAQSGSIDTIIDPPSPIKRHVKWKLARTKKTGHMTSEAAKEIADKIASHFQL